MSPISVFLVEPAATFLRGLRSYLEDEPDIQVVGAAACGEEARVQAVTLHPQVAIVDLHLKWELAEAEPAPANGLRLIKLLQQASPPAILAFTDFSAESWLRSLANVGARGCLRKEEKPAVIVSAIRAVAAGMSVWTPSQLALLRSHPLDCLSCREQEVLTLIAQGCTNGEIGERLGVNVRTVDKHVEHLFAKLGVHHRTEAVAVARRRGLVEG